jgi:hypothetical protein
MTDIDARGVMLAAIQGLHQVVKEKDAEITAMRNAHAALLGKIEAI